MTKIKIQQANLYYGVTAYPVEAHEGFPFPQEFDLDGDVVQQAMHVMAMMSNASGGHALNDCRMGISEEFKRVTIMANGAMVSYSDGSKIEGGEETAVRYVKSLKTVKLGTVVTDQYGDGWKRAKWRNPL